MKMQSNNIEIERKRGVIGIGVLGCSSRMKSILTWLLELNPNHKIVALYDIEKKAAENYKEKFGETKIYDDPKLLVNDPDIEWVFIGSSNYLHKEYIIAALNANKNIFCEKPLAISIEECEEIKRLYEQKNLNFLISYPLRYSSHCKKIKKIIDDGKIGKIISMEFNETLGFNHGAFIMTDWRRFVKYSGGYLLEKNCHDIDLANWMIGSIAKRVASFGGLNLFKPENSYILENLEKEKAKKELEDYYESYKKLILNPFASDKDIIDNQVVIIEYANGVRATFHANSSVGILERRMYICGTEGTIRADLITGKIEVKRIGPSEEIMEISDEESKEGHGGGDKFLVQVLNNAILCGKTSEASMDDAIKSAVTCLGIEKARKENRVIEMDEYWKNFGYL